MTDETDQWMELQGRLLAMERILTQLAFEWGMTQPHPPTAFAQLLRPIEEDAAKMQAEPGLHRDATRATRELIQGFGEALEAGLHKAVLIRTDTKSPGQA